jgi:HAMP domain-containing protein
MPRLFRASIFRIALVYLALMGATVGGIVAIVYWSTAGLIERQTSETVEAEIRGLAEQYDQDGLTRLVEVITERSGANGDPQNVYVLASPALVVLAGNLGTWPDRSPGPDGWIEVPLERRGDAKRQRHIVRGRAFMLAGGYRLFVGRNAAGQEDFRGIVLDALTWALGPALLFGLLGGVVIARYSLSRVDAVRVTSDEIIGGDLTHRVPLNGSGDEFDRLAQTVNRMLDRIETLMTGMRTVTDSLAHDLRSPLTRAKSGIDLALRGPTGSSTTSCTPSNPCCASRRSRPTHPASSWKSWIFRNWRRTWRKCSSPWRKMRNCP